MKVICTHIEGNRHPRDDSVKIGDIFTVINQHYSDGMLYYEFEEISGWMYVARCFAPLSSIDETEFERNYKKELA